MYSHQVLCLWTLVALSVVPSLAFPMQRHVELKLARRSDSLITAHIGVGLPALPDATVDDFRDRRNQSKRVKGSSGRTGLAAGPEVKTILAQSSNIKREKPLFSSSLHTLQLRSAKQVDPDIHPLMYFQQHLNHAHAKLATMAGDVMTPDALEAGMRKRWATLGFLPGALKLRKRSSGSPSQERRQVEDTTSSVTSQGFSRIEFEALIGNTETDGPENVENTLGLDIMSNDIAYYTDIQIGTPPRSFKILVDSGSADSWVPSQVCPTCGDHTRLGSRTSTSFAVSDRGFEVTYGLGNVEGFIARDNMKIGNLSIEGLLFGVTTFESPEFGDNRALFDGLMGTAQSILSNQRVLSPIESLGRAGAVASSAMGYALGRVADGINEGTVTFGGINPAQIDGDLIEVPNVSRVGFWEAAIEDTTVNGQSLGLQGRTASLDTGTTLILMPEADAAVLHAAIPGARSDGQGGFIVPCNTNAVVAFTFSGQSFAIDSRDLPFVPINGNDPNGDCQSGISVGNIGRSSQWLVGDVFLKSVYFATEVESNTIGLGKRR